MPLLRPGGAREASAAFCPDAVLSISWSIPRTSSEAGTLGGGSAPGSEGAMSRSRRERHATDGFRLRRIRTSTRWLSSDMADLLFGWLRHPVHILPPDVKWAAWQIHTRSLPCPTHLAIVDWHTREIMATSRVGSSRIPD